LALDKNRQNCTNPGTFKEDQVAEPETDPQAGKAKELAANKAMAEHAWDVATKGITGADDVLAAIKPRFVANIVAGLAMPDVEDDLADQLAVRDWTWPWFEDSYAMFDEWRMWPNVWPQLRPSDDGQDYSDADLAEYRKAAIAPLIISSAAMIFFRDRHISKSHMHQTWRIVHTGDAASMKSSERYSQKIKDGDLSVLPPFFPGDKTRIGADNPLKPEDDKRPDAGAAPAAPVAAAPEPAAEPPAPAKKAPAKKASRPRKKKDD
jgi:hypothetical protein